MCVRVRVCLSVCMIFPVGHVSERVELYMLICAVHREKEKEREGSEIWMRAYTSQRWLIELLCASSSCSLVWSCVEHFVCGCSILLLYVMLSAVVFIHYQCHHRPVSEWQQFAAVSRFELWPWRRRTLNLATFPSTRCTFLCTCFILKFVFFSSSRGGHRYGATTSPTCTNLVPFCDLRLGRPGWFGRPRWLGRPGF